MTSKLKLLLAALTLFNVLGCTQDNKPTRSSCIGKIDVSWIGEVHPKDASAAISDFSEFFVYIYKTEFYEGSVGPSIVRQGRPAHSLYFQFATDCQNKFEVTSRILEQYSSDIVRFNLSKEKVEPGVNTIRVSGPYWQD